MLDVKQIREDFPILNTRQHGCPLIGAAGISLS